jgi:hypothetical protein
MGAQAGGLCSADLRIGWHFRSPSLVRWILCRPDRIIICGLFFAALRITGRNDAGVFHHQDDRSIRGAGAMLDAFGNDKSLLWLQINRAIFEIDEKVPLQDKEELVVIVMFVPMVLTLHDSQANNGVVHLAERLVIPLIGTGFHQGRNVHHAKRWKLDIEVSSVRIILLFAHVLDDEPIIGKVIAQWGDRSLPRLMRPLCTIHVTAGC